MRNRSKKNWGVLCACAALSLAAVPLLADDKEHKTTGEQQTSDKQFVQEALKGNQAEVAMAEVAARKAQNPQVKQFAQEMQRDHNQANEQLRPIAQSLGVQTAQTLDDKHQKKLSRLQELQGEEFDKEFTTHALRAHKKAISKYQKAENQVQNPQLKQYISQTLPKLQQHYQHGKQVAQAVGVDQSTIAEIDQETPDAVGGTDDTEEKSDETPSTSKGAGGVKLKEHDQDKD